MTGWVGDSGQAKREITGLWVGDVNNVPREVDTAWVGDVNGVPRIWYQNVKPVTLNATAVKYAKVDLTWTDAGADTYKVFRVGTAAAIYDGVWKSKHTDSGLEHGTAYTYRVDAIKNGKVVRTDTASVTTVALPSFSLTATKQSWTRIDLSWTSLGAGFTYKLESNPYGWVISTPTTATTHQHTGIDENTTVYYRVDALYNGAYLTEAHASAKTDVRPTSTGSVNDGRKSYTSYTHSSGKSLTGPSFDTPERVNGWVTSFNMAVAGNTDPAADGGGGASAKGAFTPSINGVSLGQRETTSNVGYVSGSCQSPWQHCDGSTSVPVKPTGNTVAMSTPANSVYYTQWCSYDSAYNSHCAWGTVNYKWYTSLKAEEAMRTRPWWDEVLAGRSTHSESWLGEDGQEASIKIYDKDTGELLVDWVRRE